MLAVTGSASGASVVFHSHVAASLLAEGTNLASKLFGKFQTTSSQFQHQGVFGVDGTSAIYCNNARTVKVYESRKLVKTSENYTLSLLIVSCLVGLQFANLFCFSQSM